MGLPAWKSRESFLEGLEKNRVLVVVGEVRLYLLDPGLLCGWLTLSLQTGSGKTTQLPQYILGEFEILHKTKNV
jgi:HrpA-like RNA helicase